MKLDVIKKCMYLVWEFLALPLDRSVHMKWCLHVIFLQVEFNFNARNKLCMEVSTMICLDFVQSQFSDHLTYVIGFWARFLLVNI